MSIFKNKAAKVATAAIATGLAFGLAAPMAAQADPGTARTYQISGSDTTEGVVQYIAENSGGVLGSWNAFGSPDPITPKTGGQAVGRPHGSGDGVKALSASWNTANDVFTQVVSGVTTTYDLKNGVATGVDAINDGVREFDLARSSSKPGTAVGAGSANNKLTFVPFARDAVTPVIQDPAGGANYSTVSALTIDELNAIFGDGVSTSGRISNSAGKVYFNGTLELKPVLPQSSSGTRSFFLSAIGNPTLASWVSQGIAENDASAVDTEGQIAPFSAGQWIAQKNGTGANTFTGSNSSTLRLVTFNNGSSTALATTGTAPSLAPNTAFFGLATAEPTSATYPLARDTYTVVPTANFTGSLQSYVRNLGSTTVGGQYAVERFGFLRLTYTGTQGEYYSNWTN